MVQHSSENYQSSWEQAFQHPGTGFHLDTPTQWKVLGKRNSVTVSGRLIGGCLETLASLAGTPYAPVHSFAEKFADEGILWYLESAESSAGEIYRALWTLRENGWFRYTQGVLFGRPGGYRETKDFDRVDALHTAFGPLHVPVIYDVDIGHVPPQLTLVNGSFANNPLYRSTGSTPLAEKLWTGNLHGTRGIPLNGPYSGF
ncbi:LD-carboxypeptidase [Melghirimyces profundicolus]|uniref:LD-carboxypeptidase n=1 Tax=Melghirimyces profundicolus TaxID=1242148 RepID=A0A2T6BGC3_9BACL|nr:LD-carboxypeptidase [Melghirimyces profundicolus]